MDENVENISKSTSFFFLMECYIFYLIV